MHVINSHETNPPERRRQGSGKQTDWFDLAAGPHGRVIPGPDFSVYRELVHQMAKA